MAIFSLFYLVLNCAVFVYCKEIPPSPCPEIFQYIDDGNNEYHGLITIPYTDGGRYNITTGVGAWMPGYLPEIATHHLELTLTTTQCDLMENNTNSIDYYVKFPFKHILPLISIIEINEKRYCTGPPVPPNDGTSEFTTCGQTHYTLFSPSNEDYQPNHNNYSEQRNKPDKNDSEDKKKHTESYVQEDKGLIEVAKPTIEDDPQILHIDLPSFISENELATKVSSTDRRDAMASFSSVCGRPAVTSSLIFHGRTFPRGAYPWLVAIFRTASKLGLDYICTGSLISDKHVLTAAHCLMLNGVKIKPSRIACIFGKHNIDTWGIAEDERMIQPESIKVHREYKTGKPHADIGVILFSNPILTNQVIKPICLWDSSTDINEVVIDMGTVVGWGMQHDGVIASEPKAVTMPIIEPFLCLQTSTDSAQHALVEIVSNNTFCAGFRNDSGPCIGDSGAAFVIRKDKVFYLKGIVSTALADDSYTSCNLKEYVVFVDASKYLDWLSESF